MATVLEYIAAILPRLLFAGHCILALWLLLEFNPDNFYYWPFCVGLGCLFLESMYTIIVRKGEEYKYFWPSCFFYLCTLVPITWSAELTLLEGRVNNRTEDAKKFLAGGLLLGQEELKKLCEIGIMLLIILGRWMLPRGSITRDQLSVLLLEYVAIAADILELFEAFDDEQVSRNKEITMCTLGVFSWSLLQFALVTTSFGRKKQDEEISEKAEDALERGLSRKYLRKALEAKKRENRRRELYSLKNEEAENVMRKFEIQGDRFGILAAMFMQDGPFLILRIYLIIKYDFFMDATFLFYIGKNIVSLLLMLYRLYVIHFLDNDEKIVNENPKRFQNPTFAMLGAQRFKSNKAREATQGSSRNRFGRKVRPFRWKRTFQPTQ